MRHAGRTFAAIFVLTLLLRLPFMFSAVIDWDESTFILIGQSMVDGHLPYTRLWDVKPPLLFAFFAAVILLLGHTIEAVRVAGALCVAVAAWLVHAVAARWWNRSAGWLAAILCVSGTTLLGSGQATMSEHVVLPVFMTAVYLWAARRQARWTPYWIGVLMSAATLVRLNLAYTVAAFALLIAVDAVRRRANPGRPLASYAAGGLTMVAVAGAPFAWSGQLTLLWKSAVVAALARSESGDALSRLPELYARALTAGGDGSAAGGLLWIGALLWPGAILGMVLASLARTPAAAATLAWLTAGTLAGIVMSGGTFGHYLIQLVPLASLATAAFIHHPVRGVRTAIWMAAILLLAPSARPIVTQYRQVLSAVAAGRNPRSGSAHAIADYLRRENPSRRPVLLLADHVAYWLTGTDPPNRFATHPSTLSRPHVLAVMGTTPLAELGAIFDLPPEFVVVDPGDWPLQDDERAWLQSRLRRDYALAAEIDGREVYRIRTAR
jgi:hypothetical protein